MTTVFLCSPTNSTMFTSCCDVAICDDESFCPLCKSEVYPGVKCSDHERRVKRWEMAYGPTRRRILAAAQQSAEVQP